jgi:hypothetical protein
MSNTLIHIKNSLTNKQSIYNIDVDLEFGFLKCIEWLQKNDNKSYRYTISDDLCEIFYDCDIVKPGWIWNTNSTKKTIMYTLTKIPICIPPPQPPQSTQSTQSTQTDTTTDKSTDNLHSIITNLTQSFKQNQSNETINFTCKPLPPPLQFNQGYSSNICKWNAPLQAELRNKLSDPKFGLKSKSKSNGRNLKIKSE